MAIRFPSLNRAITALLTLAVITPAWSADTAFDATFPSFDTALWYKDGPFANGGIFLNTWDPAEIWTGGGVLHNRLEYKGNTYYSGQIRTQERYRHGRYDVWMKPIHKSGVISAFFTYIGPPQGQPHDEIDIEFLGSDPKVVDFTVYTNDVGYDPDTLIASASTRGKVDRIVNQKHGQVHLSFDPTRAIHKYSFLWSHSAVVWQIDDVTVAVANAGSKDPKGRVIAIPTTPGYITMNAWPADAPEWVGPIDKSDHAPKEMIVCEVKFTPTAD